MVLQISIIKSDWIFKKVAVPTVYHEELTLMEMGLMSLHATRQTQTENNGPKWLWVILYPGGNKGLVDMCL